MPAPPRHAAPEPAPPRTWHEVRAGPNPDLEAAPASRRASRTPAPGPRPSAAAFVPADPRAPEHAGVRYRPPSPPDGPLEPRVLALTDATGTVLSPAVPAERRSDVEAHEDVHRRQVAARGTRPVGTRDEVEAEARRGAQLARLGRGFEPTLAAPDEPLAYEHASAGVWLYDVIELLRDSTTYDVESIDWPDAVERLLASERIVSIDETTTALDLADLLRYRFLLELIAQELDEGLELAPASAPVPAGLTTPTIEDLEDVLFEDYTPTLEAWLFADSDVAEQGTAFLEHWLDRLAEISLVPAEFDLLSFAPPDRSGELASERDALLEGFMEGAVPDLMFRFMLDEFARAVAGPDATVAGAPLIVGGGEYRSITPEQWLATLDLEEYRDRLVEHLGTEFDRLLRTDRTFRRLLVSAADQQSRFRSLAAVHLAIVAQQDELDAALEDLPVLPLGELDDAAEDLLSFPAETYERLAAASRATQTFYSSIGRGLDNDAALLTAVDALVDALTGSGEHEVIGALLRVVTYAGALKTLVEDQTEAAHRRIDELVEVSYEQVAADIQEMATYAATYLEETWIPTLHDVALRRISANHDLLCERRDNWDVYAAEMIGKLRAGAVILTDVADALEEGLYESVTLGDLVVTAEDAYRLRDAATVMSAEADVLSDPEGNSERYAELEEAIGGFADVKGRIERGEVDPNLYGPEVLAEAKQELGLDTFREYTTYADVLFGREVAASNPFLARLVVTWKFAEVLDDSLRAITIFVGLGLLTIASLLVGALGAVAAMVMFAIDATLAIGTGVYQVTAAEALLELVRLDLDQSVTGLTVEQAENALLWAWVGLAVSIVLTVGGLALGVALRYGTAAGDSIGISLNYFRVAVQEPELFASLRAIVRDPVRLSKLLDLAGEARDLETLLHRMDAVLDLARAERLLDLTGDAAQLNRMLDVGHDAAAVETALGQLHTAVPHPVWRARLLDAAGDDVVALADLAAFTDDLHLLRGLLRRVPADRLLVVARARPLTEVEEMLARGVRAQDVASGVGAPSGGLAPATTDVRVPLPPDVAATVDRAGLGSVTALKTATPHEARRLAVVLGSNPLPKKAQPVAQTQAAAWAADGATGPTDVINRWEYLRQRFRTIRGEIDPAAYPNQNLDTVAGRLLADEITSGALTRQLAGDVGSVRSLTGSGWASVPGTSTDEVVASVRANADRMTFGTETTTAYHARKHGGELPPSESAAPTAGFEGRLGAYVGGARRALTEGTVTGEITNGTGTLTFSRVVREPSGVERRMTALVFVRDGRALISTFGGATL